MRMCMKSRVWCPAAVLISICMASGLAAAASGPQYLVTNDDVAPFFFTGVSFFTVGAGGTLELDKEVQTGGSGTGGGFFGANRVAVLNQGTSQCV